VLTGKCAQAKGLPLLSNDQSDRFTGNLVKPSGNLVKLSENPVKPSENPVKPSGNLVKPSENPVKPSENPGASFLNAYQVSECFMLARMGALWQNKGISSLILTSMTQTELIALIDQAAAEGWTELDLSGKGLTELPPQIGKLTQLETLILGKQDFEQKGPEGRAGWKQENDQWMPIVMGNALTTLPPELKALTHLKVLDLSGNRWVSFPSFLWELSSLEKLKLLCCSLTKVPAMIVYLTNLTELDFDGNQITEIPAVITHLTNLTELSLNSNQITEIPEAIAQLSNLSTLNLHSNQITEIPEAIAQLSNLTKLYLSSNQITEIPEAIAQLSNLTTLYLSSNQITEIPEAIAQLSNLSTLSLDSNQITEIPAAIAQLSNLTKLYLSSNQITKIPEAIAQLSNLSMLGLSSNQITEIPAAIAQLSNLTELYLYSNQITEIPEAIAQLSNLTELYLYSNQITEIPEAIAQLSNLTQLGLSSNQITEIPAAIAQLSNLSTLFLHSNQITEIPEAIAQLSNLTQLYLHSNQITEMPEAIAQLSNLTELYLYSNQITEIPEAIAQLSNLTTLDLENNKINEIPIALTQLSQLTKLDLRNNPLPISTEILGPPDVSQAPGSTNKIFRYLREMHSGEKRQLNEAKLLLIGQGSVGKTSLINRLIHNQYNPQQSQTDGLTVSNWIVTVNTKPVRLHVWDFGGQEIYHATHQFFLTKRSLYILTCNCRTSEDENRLEYWLKLIQSFGGNSPVIIVGNKCDEQPLDINRKALRDKYPNIKHILETSCANSQGILDLQEKIIHEVSQLHDVYNLLPLTWFQVKEQLEAMDQDFISYPQYTNLCYQQNVTQEQSQEQLIDLLHNLGLVLNFREHPILKDTNVLNPDWVTTGIYTLLSDDTLKTHNKGILTSQDLTRILPADRYPAQRHPYLTELMQEFQLGFPLTPAIPAISNGQPQKFLIPGLLPKEEPKNTELEGDKQNDTLQFQYHYKVLPESIISRFIVLTHADIYSDTYWRSGVMLHYTDSGETCNIARIKADPEDQKIFIAISGKQNTRRTFLAMLRKTFDTIHNSFTNLEVTEWVPVPNHPDHPPLDYQELLGLEKMGEQTYPIGKLGIRVNIRQLLDGYEPLQTRQQRRRDELGKAGHYEEEMLDRAMDRAGYPGGIRDINIHLQQTQGENKPMSTTINQHGQGDNIGGDKVLGDKIGTQHNHSTDLAQAAHEIHTLLTQLDQQYEPTNPDRQELIESKAIKAIQSNPTLKKRMINALKEGSASALESAIAHPLAKPVIATIKGFIDG